MSNVISIGAFAFNKNGPEGVTLYQLAQAEEEGLWNEQCEIGCPNCKPATIYNFCHIREGIYLAFLKTHFGRRKVS